MRFWFSGPRILGIRPGISLSPNDFRARQKPTSQRVEGSFVYVIKAPNDRVKIGVTKNPSARLAALQTGSHTRLRYAFIGVTPGEGYDIEAAAHNVLAAHRLEGEWFDVPDEMAVAAITSCAWKLGQPVLAISQTQADQVLAIGAAEDQQAEGGPSWIMIFLRIIGYICCAIIGVLGAFIITVIFSK